MQKGQALNWVKKLGKQVINFEEYGEVREVFEQIKVQPGIGMDADIYQIYLMGLLKGKMLAKNELKNKAGRGALN